MKPAEEVSAEEIVDTDPVTVEEESSLSQVKNAMEEHDLRAVPVVDDRNRLRGAVGYRDLVRFIQFNPEKTSLQKVMHQPPGFEPGDSLVELADLRINSGRKMMVLEDEGLEGVIGDSEFLEGFTEAEELEDVSTRTVQTDEVLTVEEDDTLEKARHMMLDNNISRLPVLENDSLTGVIDSVDILRMMIPRESQAAGGTSGGRHGKDVHIAGGEEKESMSDITVDQLMQPNPVSSSSHMKVVEAAEEMLEQSSDEIIFVDDDYPNGIVTVKDVVDYVADLEAVDTVLVQLTGLEVPEEKAAIHNAIKRQLQGSLGRKLDRPEEVTLRIKKAEKDGRKHRYEIDLKLFSEYGTTTVNESGWDLLDVVDEALEELNRIVRDEHGKRTEHR